MGPGGIPLAVLLVVAAIARSCGAEPAPPVATLPMWRDPRASQECRDAIADDVARQTPGVVGWATRPDVGGWDGLKVFTREDALFNRTRPHRGPQFTNHALVCADDETRLVLRVVPKAASQSLIQMTGALHAKLGNPRCTRQSTPFAFAFVRHPYARLVSALITVTRGISLRGGCPSKLCTRGARFWNRWSAAVRGRDRNERFDVYKVLATMGVAEARGLFEDFVEEALLEGTVGEREDAGRRGVESMWHHVRTQMYFLAHTGDAGKVHELRFVGRTEFLDRDFTAVVANATKFRHRPAFFDTEDPFAVALHGDVRGAKRDATNHSSVVHNVILAPHLLRPHILEGIRRYYLQDFLCFGYDADPATWASIPHE